MNKPEKLKSGVDGNPVPGEGKEFYIYDIAASMSRGEAYSGLARVVADIRDKDIEDVSRSDIDFDPCALNNLFENLPEGKLRSDAEFTFQCPLGYKITMYDNGTVVFVE